MKIPKKLKLLGHTIDVLYDPQLALSHDCTGEAHYRFSEIRLQPLEGYVGRKEEKLQHDFFHELIHFILYYTECSDTKELWKNENVVDRIASLLHQAVTTAEYE